MCHHQVPLTPAGPDDCSAESAGLLAAGCPGLAERLPVALQLHTAAASPTTVAFQSSKSLLSAVLKHSCWPASIRRLPASLPACCLCPRHVCCCPAAPPASRRLPSSMLPLAVNLLQPCCHLAAALLLAIPTYAHAATQGLLLMRCLRSPSNHSRLLLAAAPAAAAAMVPATSPAAVGSRSVLAPEGSRAPAVTDMMADGMHSGAPHCTTLHHTAPHCTTLHRTAAVVLCLLCWLTAHREVLRLGHLLKDLVALGLQGVVVGDEHHAHTAGSHAKQNQ